MAREIGHNVDLVNEILKYERYLMKVALSFTYNIEDAKDLVQDTFERAIKNIENFEENRGIKNWLITILKNRLIDNCRTEKRKKNSGYIPEIVTYNNCFYNFVLEDFIYEINNFKYKKSKEIFLMMLSGFKYEEISKKLDMNINAVKATIFRVRKKLKNKL